MTTQTPPQNNRNSITVKSNITVLGAGSWGTALAHHLTVAGHEVLLWGKEDAVLEDIQHRGKNTKYFGEIPFRARIATTNNLLAAVSRADVLVFAVPSDAIRQVARDGKQELASEALLVSAAKGLEVQSLSRVSEVLESECGGKERIGVLSGPSFAREVLLGLPTAVTAASSNLETAKRIAALFHFDYLRVYTSDDLVGVELGGVIKNVIALATGVIDGLELGNNGRAAIITRGLVEMQRLATALGAKPQTLMGLSGLGDLILTATGDLSRNRRVGIRLGRGENLNDIVRDIGQVAEGVTSAKTLSELAERHHVEVPIITEVSRFVSGESSAAQSISKLLSRPARHE